jgi:hypothetical protein
LSHWCGNPNPTEKDPNFSFRNVTITFEIRLRSPTAVFEYLGALVRKGRVQTAVRSVDDGANPLADKMNYFTRAVRELGSEPFLNIVSGRNVGCNVHIIYLGIDYCIPMQGSMNTGMILQILQRLRNLSVSPADLNVPYNVRLLQ